MLHHLSHRQDEVLLAFMTKEGSWSVPISAAYSYCNIPGISDMSAIWPGTRLNDRLFNAWAASNSCFLLERAENSHSAHRVRAKAEYLIETLWKMGVNENFSASCKCVSCAFRLFTICSLYSIFSSFLENNCDWKV